VTAPPQRAEQATLGQRARGALLDDTGAIGKWSISGRISQAGLPGTGKIRYVPPTNYRPGTPLSRGGSHGDIDSFGNEWVKGPSRTADEAFEWDVQLSDRGRASIGWLSREGDHVNLSLNGRVTH
jgi:filamentous hemagglutinin